MGVGDLTIQQLQEIKEAFELFDTDSSGKNPAPATHGGLLATGLARVGGISGCGVEGLKGAAVAFWMERGMLQSWEIA